MTDTIYKKDLAPFRGELCLVVTKDIATFAEAHNVENIDSGDSAMFFEKFGDDGEMDFYIVVDASSKIILRDLLHEIVHFKNAVMKYFGVKHDMDNDEWEAYFIEFYAAWCIAKIKPKLNSLFGFYE